MCMCVCLLCLWCLETLINLINTNTLTQTHMHVGGWFVLSCAVEESWDPFGVKTNHRALEQLGLHVD